MASYQQIDTRLAVLEDMIGFVMTQMRMRAVQTSGLSGPDGKPLPGTEFEGSLLDIYRLSRQMPVLRESDGVEAPEIK
jgi:hypothetical protein